MSDSNLKRFALFAEIIGGVAVVFSLIFVGLEIRQSSEETALNTRTIQANAYQDLVNQISQLSLSVIGDREVADIWNQRIIGAYSDDPIIDRQIQMTNYYVTRHADMAFFQYQQGLISESRLGYMLGIFRQQLNTDRGKEQWEFFTSNEGLIEPEFVSYVRAMMAERRPDDAYWNDN